MDGIERHAPGDAIAYPTHVKSMGIVIAPRRYRNMSPKFGRGVTRTIATDCISIMPDGTRKVFAPAKAKTTNVAGIIRRTSNKVTTRADVDHALMSKMGTIHETN